MFRSPHNRRRLPDLMTVLLLCVGLGLLATVTLQVRLHGERAADVAGVVVQR